MKKMHGEELEILSGKKCYKNWRINMDAEAIVKAIYPTAYATADAAAYLIDCHEEYVKSKIKWRIYHTYKVGTTSVHIQLGFGVTKQKAWKMAFEAIQRIMLTKLEYGIEAG